MLSYQVRWHFTCFTLITCGCFVFSMSHSLWPHNLYLFRMKNQHGDIGCTDVVGLKQQFDVKTTHIVSACRTANFVGEAWTRHVTALLQWASMRNPVEERIQKLLKALVYCSSITRNVYAIDFVAHWSPEVASFVLEMMCSMWILISCASSLYICPNLGFISITSWISPLDLLKCKRFASTRL